MVTEKVPVLHGICVENSGATMMRSTHTAYITLPHLSLYARRVHILPPMKDCCLISDQQLREDGFEVNFDTNNYFYEKGKIPLLIIGIPPWVSI